MHVDRDDTLKQGVIDSLGREQFSTFINESGLYSLILSYWMKAHLGYRSGRRPKNRVPLSGGSRRCMMSIYKPNLWLNQWYRGENAHFLLTWKIRIATKYRKINGGQNQHLEARNQAPFSPKLALFPFKNAVLWDTLKVPHNPQLDFSLHPKKNNYTQNLTLPSCIKPKNKKCNIHCTGIIS